MVVHRDFLLVDAKAEFKEHDLAEQEASKNARALDVGARFTVHNLTGGFLLFSRRCVRGLNVSRKAQVQQPIGIGDEWIVALRAGLGRAVDTACLVAISPVIVGYDADAGSEIESLAPIALGKRCP